MAEPKENYGGALLVALVGGLLFWWALRDPDGLIYSMVFLMAQVHL